MSASRPCPSVPVRVGPCRSVPVRHSIRRELVAGRRCITVVPQGAPLCGAFEVLVARSFQAAFRKAMDLAGLGGRLSTEETAP